MQINDDFKVLEKGLPSWQRKAYEKAIEQLNIGKTIALVDGEQPNTFDIIGSKSQIWDFRHLKSAAPAFIANLYLTE